MEHEIDIAQLDAYPEHRDRLIESGILEIMEVEGKRVPRFVTPDQLTLHLNEKVMIRILQNVIGPPSETGLHSAVTADELVWLGLESLVATARNHPHVLRDLVATHRHVMAGGGVTGTAH